MASVKNLLGGLSSKLRSAAAAAAAAAAPEESAEAAVSSPDFSDGANNDAPAAAGAAAECAPRKSSSPPAPPPPPVSIRDDERFHKKVAKKQGHSMELSAKNSSTHGRRGPPDLRRLDSAGESSCSSVQNLSSHARRQVHCKSLSVANLAVHSCAGDVTRGENYDDVDDDGVDGGRAGGGGPQEEERKAQPRRSIVTIHGTIEEEETYARDHAESRPLALFFWNGLSSVIVFIKYLISIDSVLSLVLSCGLTHFYWERTKDNEHFDGTMSFVLLGFAVLMPLSVSVRITFSRREKALENIASLQTHAHSIYLCHACWDWGKAPGGRSEDQDRWLRHSDEVLRVLVAIGDELTRFLTLPNSSFSRHRETARGRREAAVTISASYRIFGDVIQRRVTRLATLLEEMKLAGFSASEASRVRQYEKLVAQAVQNLRMLKMYRSPKALNALLNVATTLLPPFYAPAFAQIAHDSGSLAVAMGFAAITSLALSALYESVQVLEDPFVAFLTLDGIDVYEELAVLYYHQLIETRREIYPTAHEFHEAAEEKDTLSDIFDSDCDVGYRNDDSSWQVLDRRAMMMRGQSQRINSKKELGKNDRRAGMGSMKRQSVFQLDVPSYENSSKRSRRSSRRSSTRRSSHRSSTSSRSGS